MNTPPIELIATELQRQQLKYNPEHDDQHAQCELLAAAANYMFYGATCDVPGLDGIPYPFEDDLLPRQYRIDNLVCAASLICAEIARLQRLK